MYLFAFGNRRQPCISVKHVLKCSNAICEWPELSIPIKYVVLYCIEVTCLATDVSLTADPGVASSVPLPSAESFKKGCCQLQAKVCARSTG